MMEGALPRWLWRAMLAGLREVIGAHNLESVLRMAQVAPPPLEAPLTRDVSWSALNRLGAALVDLYGEDEGLSIARRAGQRTLQQAWQGWWGARLMEMATWLLPPTQELYFVLLILADMFNRTTGLHVQLTSLADGYRWELAPWEEGAGARPLQTWMCGLLEGALQMGGATTWEVSEASDSNVACVLHIKRKAA